MKESARYITSNWLKFSVLVKEKMAKAHKKHIRFTHNVMVHMTEPKE
jgi:hypothetical protein